MNIACPVEEDSCFKASNCQIVCICHIFSYTKFKAYLLTGEKLCGQLSIQDSIEARLIYRVVQLAYFTKLPTEAHQATPTTLYLCENFCI